MFLPLAFPLLFLLFLPYSTVLSASISNVLCLSPCLSLTDFPLSVCLFPFLSSLCLSLKADRTHTHSQIETALALGTESLVSSFAPSAATQQALETGRRSQCPASSQQVCRGDVISAVLFYCL